MRKYFLPAIALSLPMLVFFAGYIFYHAEDIQPTGFIQYDNVSYVAYGKQYNDADEFHLQYSNPFNENNNYKPIYFQPQSLFFALLMKAGVPPGWILIPFSILCSLICFLLILRIYDFLVPEKKFRTLNTWFFAWGGGLLTIAGFFTYYVLSRQENIDPENGWWGLSLGRSLFFSCEAYYHALFLGCIYFLLKRKWIISIVLILLLSLSHPFTGLELAAIVSAWCIFEFFFNRKEIPVWFALASIGIVCFHLYYYLVYLPQFSDHQSVNEQYTLRWRLGIYRILPAYCIVGVFAVASIYKASLKKFLQVRSNRIFLGWFLIAFLLSNHEVFMKARQPIHFTRGYVWTGLFLLGLPALQSFNQYVKSRFKITGLVIFSCIFLLDNFIWITASSFSKANTPSVSYITREQKNIFKILDSVSTNQTLIISNDNIMAYLSTVYTKAYPWHSHIYTTPFAQKKLEIQNLFFKKGIFDTAWTRRDVNFILQRNDSIAANTLEKINAKRISETNHYLIYHYKP